MAQGDRLKASAYVQRTTVRLARRAGGMVKKALCCGLNYPNRKYQLYGCINDCLDWEHLLKSIFQFDESRVLIDQNPDGTLASVPTQVPTRANILAQLGWLCTGAQPGDCLVFVFAGHGCQVKTASGLLEALVPEDFDGGSDPALVTEDEMHLLFQRLPPGVMLTVVLDCCHASRMLDVPCSMEWAQRQPRTTTTVQRTPEVPRTEASWEQATIGHAQARPRFVPTASAPARQRRLADGIGAQFGKMTLDPGVTAFLFAAARTNEAALDANMKKHQRGVMSFCLMEALLALRHRCTYEMLLEKASEKLEDIREKYMPTMDAHLLMTFCPNSAPSEVVVFDDRYATVAQFRLQQQMQAAGRQGNDIQLDGAATPHAVRQASTDFVPTPSYQPPDAQRSAAPPAPREGGPPPARLYLVVYSVVGAATIAQGAPCEPFVVARVGSDEYEIPPIGVLDPIWEDGNQLTFPVHEADQALELEVMNAARNDLLGRTLVELKSLPPMEWHRRRLRLQDPYGRQAGEAEVEVALRMEPPAPSAFPELFGTPNLLGAMPNLLSSLYGAGGGACGSSLSTSAYSGGGASSAYFPESVYTSSPQPTMQYNVPSSYTAAPSMMPSAYPSGISEAMYSPVPSSYAAAASHVVPSAYTSSIAEPVYSGLPQLPAVTYEMPSVSYGGATPAGVVTTTTYPAGASTYTVSSAGQPTYVVNSSGGYSLVSDLGGSKSAYPTIAGAGYSSSATASAPTTVVGQPWVTAASPVQTGSGAVVGYSPYTQVRQLY